MPASDLFKDTDRRTFIVINSADDAQAWRKLANSEGATSAEQRFHGGEAPKKIWIFVQKL